jgi:UDP-N-acetylglucosamine 4-epimerase
LNKFKKETVSFLKKNKFSWLVTGAAGFIGSNLVEALLNYNQRVVGLDNFLTGHQRNIESITSNLSSLQKENFHFVESDITNIDDCKNITSNIDYVLHQAAVGSVPRSIEKPLLSHENNINGFLNILIACKENKVKNLVYAASSSTYGDNEQLPKVENIIGNPLSPYAVTKYVNELYAGVFSKVYGLNTVGLRYFNVFGRRQDPHGSYAAVIPRWINAMMHNEEIAIFGDGLTSRDFCYIDNVIEANILAALASKPSALNTVYNVAKGDSTSLNNLFTLIKDNLMHHQIHYTKEPFYAPFRDGDIRHSMADISKSKRELGYDPRFAINKGIKETVRWFVSNNA